MSEYASSEYTVGTFTQPAIGSTVEVSTTDTDDLAIANIVFIETAGYYKLTEIISSEVVELQYV